MNSLENMDLEKLRAKARFFEFVLITGLKPRCKKDECNNCFTPSFRAVSAKE